MKKFVMNLQLFNDGEEQGFDLDQELAAFEAEWDDDSDVEDEETFETDEEAEGEEESSDEEDDSEPDEEVETPQEPKANEAFAKMRRELQEKSKYASIVEKIAEQNGMTPEQLLEQYEQRQLQQEAEKQNVPVDVLKRINDLEAENKRIREQEFSSRFNTQVETTKEKFSLGEQDIKTTIDFIAQNGLDPNKVSFEQAYKLANFDKLVEQKVEEARQKELSEKKRKRESAAIPQGESASQQSGDLTDDFVEQELKRMGLSL